MTLFDLFMRFLMGVVTVGMVFFFVFAIGALRREWRLSK